MIAKIVCSLNIHARAVGYLRPYNRENTASRPICEVKHVLAWIVVRSGRTREVQVLQFFFVLSTKSSELVHVFC